MLYELAYPGLCAAAALRYITQRPRPAGPLFAFRAVRGRMRRRELALATFLHPRLGAALALARFEAAAPEQVSEAASELHNGLVERRFGPGTGPRILLLHGWNAESRMMLPLAQSLAERGAHVIVPDLPGEGRNVRRVLSFAAKARAIATHYRNEPLAAIMGHSAGGLIAAQAVEAGLNPRRMVTACAPFSMATLLHAYLYRVGAPQVLYDAVLALYQRREQRQAETVGPPLYTWFGSDLLVVHARTDWQVRVAEADAICEANPAARRITLDRCNHHTILNDSRLFEAVAGFLIPGAQKEADNAQRA